MTCSLSILLPQTETVQLQPAWNTDQRVERVLPTEVKQQTEHKTKQQESSLTAGPATFALCIFTNPSSELSFLNYTRTVLTGTKFTTGDVLA